MAVEQPEPDELEAQHEAIVELHEAIAALERHDARCAWNHAQCALAWLREVSP